MSRAMWRLWAYVVLAACSSTHGGDTAPDADPVLFGDVRSSRPIASLSSDELQAMCDFVNAHYYATGEVRPDMGISCPIPAVPDGVFYYTVPNCITGGMSPRLDPRCPLVGDYVHCNNGLIEACRAGTMWSEEVEHSCRQLLHGECTMGL